MDEWVGVYSSRSRWSWSRSPCRTGHFRWRSRHQLDRNRRGWDLPLSLSLILLAFSLSSSMSFSLESRSTTCLVFSLTRQLAEWSLTRSSSVRALVHQIEVRKCPDFVDVVLELSDAPGGPVLYQVFDHVHGLYRRSVRSHYLQDSSPFLVVRTQSLPDEFHHVAAVVASGIANKLLTSCTWHQPLPEAPSWAPASSRSKWLPPVTAPEASSSACPCCSIAHQLTYNFCAWFLKFSRWIINIY